ncbi:DUF1499 domain-containing protein [Microbulbifer flavimaris]|uniref:DUF1499 domain-containing protein n=1 Tax=Microbulbifer flavimaris TaxID=1781068 RepID=A0ABX4HVG9_9GAMM|nr:MULTISPECIES: DUF1499 domain-containing protein [Microbulbifer]KUJ79187.1 hypothetical protein AVO43_15540 [Microbulbifer sp. ZGT114]PCO04110.1 DUF1499 domain-containing protein [Microbulbifer flavimaris]
MRNRHWSRWLYRVQWLLLTVIFLAAVALRLELLHFRTVFKVFQYAGLAAIGVALISILVFIWGLVKRHASARQAAMWGTLLGLLPVAVPLLTVGPDNFKVPPIHDISTDLKNPPEYRAVVSLRDPGDNSVAYDGEEVAKQQREADIYADIQPLMLKVPVEQATEMAARVAEELGWRIVDRDDKSGHLEAVDRTLLLGFSDDVVVRVTATEDGSRVDVRSSSRVGLSDLGKNAERIREFLSDLEARAKQAG